MAMLDQPAGERGAGESATLIGVEDVLRAVFRERFLHRRDTELRRHRDRHSPGQNFAAQPLILSLSKDDHGGRIDAAARHRDGGDSGPQTWFGRSNRGLRGRYG